MKIAILGTRGIPNHYGGFEQFAEHLALGLTQRSHEVTVYNSHNHPYQESSYHGVKIQHIYDPEKKIGTVGQFFYDLLSIIDTRSKDFDLILQLGYTSSSVFFKLHPKNTIVITNMDGLEHQRSKYSSKVQAFLRWAESLAVKESDHLVSDSLGIQEYLYEKYQVTSTYIPYGAHPFTNPQVTTLKEYDLTPKHYNLLIARLEPENSIQIILDGVCKATESLPFLVIGNHESKYAHYLKERYQEHTNIIFLGGIYDQEKLNNLRYFCKLYFHGHTVGGTNPSLLEAMASQALIVAHKNIFNSTILEEDAFYFSSQEEVTQHLNSVQHTQHYSMLKNNIKKIETLYSWEHIIDKYERLFTACTAY